MRKYLSPVATGLLQGCAETLDTSVDALVEEFDVTLKSEVDDYSKRLVEFCSFKALESVCCRTGEKIADGSFSRLTFDMMLAWESSGTTDEDANVERISKEKEDRKEPLKGNQDPLNDDIPLFYTDVMPLLADEGPTVGEDAYVWLASIMPLVADIVNARFTYESLTESTAGRLHFPAYDRFLKELDKYCKDLQRHSCPVDYELAKDEFALHVEGTSGTQRVVRHIGETSWPGRLTLTNKALYFEASGVVSFEGALRIDLSNPSIDHQVKAASTGPWGAPLYDKAISYNSSELSEPLVLEFSEMASSTRRDHWLALIKEVLLMHKFISDYKLEKPPQAWEMQARTILGVLRLHAARQLLRMAPPAPTNFLIFSLLDELPKGDYVLEELSNSLKQRWMNLCSATSVLNSLSISVPSIPSDRPTETKEGYKEPNSGPGTLSSLDTTIEQMREESRETSSAKATVEGLKEQGISDSLVVLMELLSPLENVLSWMKGILKWERPAITVSVLAMLLVIAYKEWVGYAIAASLMAVVGAMLWARRKRIGQKFKEFKVSTSSDKTTMESLVSAKQNLDSLDAMVKTANISILKTLSVLVSKAPKHSDQVMLALTGVAVLLAAVPFKFVVMGLVLYVFLANLRPSKSTSGDSGNRRLREWWESIPVVPVRTDYC